jgi:predicted DsbA family dithiol-disulfide isomerase
MPPSTERRPRIDLWFDYNCPFCYVGRASAASVRERVGAEVHVHPFDLHPEYPPDGLPRAERDRRHGGAATLEAWRALMARAGLPEPNQPEQIANTRTALALTVFAATKGASFALCERLFADYWAHARDLRDRDVLLAAAVAAGLDRAEADAALDEPRWRAAVEQATQAALALGFTGVPAFVLERQAVVSGPEPPEVLERMLTRLAAAGERSDERSS